MERSIQLTDEQRMFQDSFRKFLEREVVPSYPQWEEEGVIPRDIWKKCGDNGYLLPWAGEAYGGAEADFLFSVIITEEIARAGVNALFLSLHNDMIAPYLESFGTQEQKKAWLPGCVSGDTILGIAMTEPGAGSDLAGLKTTAKKSGKHWVLNGQKTFISNGILADLVIVAAKTGKPDIPPQKAVSLFVVERNTPGFSRGRPLKKIGLKAQDSAELFFSDCEIPADNLLGKEGEGFSYLMQKLQQERLIVAIESQASAEACLDLTVNYTRERSLFGKSLSEFQNTRFTLAELASEIAVGRSFVDDLINRHMTGEKIVKETCMAKFWNCEMCCRVADRCLQLFGGYGYCSEYPISRFYLDARARTIYAGTSEVMKLIIGRELFPKQ